MNQLAVNTLSANEFPRQSFSRESFSKEQDNSDTFQSIASDILSSGFSIQPLGLPYDLATKLQSRAQSLNQEQYNPAGVGREEQFSHNQFVRSDSIHWLDGKDEAEQEWYNWVDELKSYLNQKLLLGLFSFESHFAWYQPGQFYKRHLDAFQGEANRILSVVVYLNDDWQLSDGGELVLYKNEHDLEGTKVLPRFATVATFLSEEFPHEVLPATRDRLSIAGWFRLNQTFNGHLAPPN